MAKRQRVTREQSPERFSDKISKILRHRQGHFGYSLNKVSRLSDLSPTTTEDVLDGYLGVSVYNLQKVARALSVDMKELF